MFDLILTGKADMQAAQDWFVLFRDQRFCREKGCLTTASDCRQSPEYKSLGLCFYAQKRGESLWPKEIVTQFSFDV